MNVFDKPRSIIRAYNCKWIGWFREKVLSYSGEDAEKLTLSCSNPEMIYKKPILFTTIDVCRVCDKWCRKDNK